MIKGERYFTDALAQIPDGTREYVRLSMGVADRIAGVLSRRNMSQKDLAALMGRSGAEVSRWLSGTHNFTLSTVAKISAALGESLISVPKP